MKKPVMSIVLVVAFLLFMFIPVETKAETKKEILEISSVSELKEFASKVNSGKNYAGEVVRLTANIEFDNSVNNFNKIGNCESGYGSKNIPFCGEFDGAGYTISGIDCEGNGLFSLTQGATIKNLVLKDCTFDGGEFNTGSIVGNAYSTTIYNCHVIGGNVSAKSPERGSNIIERRGCIGGLAGYCKGSEIINCSNSSEIIGDGLDVGGLVGLLSGDVCNSYNAGAVKAVYSGGIIGTSDSNTTVQNCYNIGNAKYGIARDGKGTYGNCYCSEESAEMNFNAVEREKNVKAYSLSFMNSDDYLTILNTNAKSKDDWMAWEFNNNSEYPQLAKPVEQKLLVTPSKTTIKSSVLKKKAAEFKIKVSSSKTKIGYKVVSGKKYLSVSNKGTVKVKKGTPKGTYKINVTASENAKFKSASKKITIVVK